MEFECHDIDQRPHVRALDVCEMVKKRPGMFGLSNPDVDAWIKALSGEFAEETWPILEIVFPYKEFL